MGHINFERSSFKRMPVTACRMVKCWHYIFAENPYILSEPYLQPWQKAVISEAYYRPLIGVPDTNEVLHKSSLSARSMNLLMGYYKGAVVHRIHPWILSSTFTIAYFMHKHQDECRKSYKIILSGSSERLSVIDLKLIVNKYILDASGEEYGLADEQDLATRGMTRTEINNLRSVIKGSRCRQEMQQAFKHANFYLAYDEKYEEDMKLFFKLNELPGYPIPKKLKKRMLVFDANVTVQEPHMLGKGIPEVEDAVYVVPKNVAVRALVHGQKRAVDDSVATEDVEEDAQTDSDSNAEVAQAKPPRKKRKQQLTKEEKVPPHDAPEKKKKKKQEPAITREQRRRRQSSRMSDALLRICHKSAGTKSAQSSHFLRGQT